MDTVSLQDRRSGRSVVIRRPLSAYMAPREVVALEEIVLAWGNIVAEEQAEEALDRTAAGRPERVLYGLLWLTGLWCSLCHARTGVPLDEVIGGLDYQGLRRELSGMDDETWTFTTHLVRRGVLAIVDSDADVREYLRLVKMFDPSLHAVRRQLLTILDGLTQDMQRNDLAPWGAAASVITGARWAD